MAVDWDPDDPHWRGVSIAPGDNMFTVAPTWERLDAGVSGLRVAEMSIRRGRQDELERTDTGTTTILFNDVGGILDPTNPASPYFGQELISKPIAISVRDPVANEWWPRFRGVIADYGYDLHPSQVVGQTAIVCVDWFAYLSRFHLHPGVAGDPPPRSASGYVFYEDTAGTVQDRFIQLAADGGIPPELYSFFTGNVRVQECIYSARETLLTAFLEAADAEFPTVANLFTDKYGVLCFHGRYARFDPDAVAATATHWDFNRWKAGDGAAIVGDSDRAQLRPPFGFDRTEAMIRNSALCHPKGINSDDIEDQRLEDAASIGAPGWHGVKGWEATDLILSEGVTTGNTAKEECLLFAQYIIDNYAQPQNRPGRVSFKPLHPSDSRAARTWALICRVDISDAIDFSIGHPGGGGFTEEQAFVEGISETIRPLVKDLDTGYSLHEITLDLSPAAYWAENPFPPLA